MPVGRGPVKKPFKESLLDSIPDDDLPGGGKRRKRGPAKNPVFFGVGAPEEAEPFVEDEEDPFEDEFEKKQRELLGGGRGSSYESNLFETPDVGPPAAF